MINKVVMYPACIRDMFFIRMVVTMSKSYFCALFMRLRRILRALETRVYHTDGCDERQYSYFCAMIHEHGVVTYPACNKRHISIIRMVVTRGTNYFRA